MNLKAFAWVIDRTRKESKGHNASLCARMTTGDELNKKRDLLSRGRSFLSHI